METAHEPPKADETATASIRMRHGQDGTGEAVTLTLPAPEDEIDRAVADHGAEDTLWRCVDCPIAALVDPITAAGSLREANALALTLKGLTEKKLDLLKALLEAKGFPPLHEAMVLIGRLDEYGLEPKIHSVEDAAKWELRFLLAEPEAEKLIPCVDLTTYGQLVMREYRMRLTSYGGLSPLADTEAFREESEKMEGNTEN